jgi:threonyl-tRNA synthetase
VKVFLPDGTELELADDATGLDAARSIGEGLARAAIAIEWDGQIRDLSAAVDDGATIRILTERDPEALEVIRHDAAHVLATAVKELYPGVKVTIGPPIENGFYYDFDFPDGVTVGEDDL